MAGHTTPTRSVSQGVADRVAGFHTIHVEPLTLARVMPWIQGAYFLLTGVWPLVHIRSFIWVTGPKTDHLPTGLEADHWLVMTAGVLITAVGAALLVAAWRGRHSAEIVTLAVGASLGLTAIDLIYVSRGVIAPIYLLDAFIQALLIGGWGIALFTEPSRWRSAARE
jgi:hypothetical protein